jgi:tetratricopeptide (TPR) repeat protein
MKINTLKHILCATALAASLAMNAQNTIGGTKAIVPEAEVKRQSAFLDAEKERLLNQHDKAIDLYKAFVYDNPKVDAAWYGLARSYVAKDDLLAAMDAIGKAVKIAPENPWYRILQAELFVKVGRLSDAIATYQALSAQSPQTEEYYKQLAYLHVLNNDPRSGLKALDNLEKITGIDEEISDKKHIIYVGLGDDRNAAAELQRLADAFPRNMAYRHRLAKFYETMGDTENARKTYQDILRRNPNDPVAKIGALGKDKNSSDAAFLNSLKPVFADPSAPIDAKIKEIIPYVPKMAGDPALTQTLLELGQSLEKTHPDDPKAWSVSGDLLYQLDRNAEALERYRRCIRLGAKVFSVWDNLLAILAAQKQYADMLQAAEQAIDAFPNQPKAYFYYAAAANLLGRHDDALQQLEQALLMVGNNAPMRWELQDQVGLALLGKKDYAAAVARYEQFVAKGGDQHPGLLEHYGDALSLSGQHSNALTQWKKALNLRKSPQLEQKIAAGKIGD